MGSIGKFLTDDLLGITQYPDTKHASALYDEAYRNTQQQAEGAQQNAQQGYGEAKGYRDEAGGLYRNLASMGLSDRNNAYSLLSPVLGEYGVTAGLSTPLNLPASAAGVTPGTNRTTPGTGGAAAALNSRTGAPTVYDSRTMPGPAPTATSGAPAKSDPYALTLPQETQANSQIDAINREKQSVMEDLKARYAQQGVTDPRAMEAGLQQIAERYDAIAAQQKASFAENARANREEAVQWAANFLNDLMKTGTSTYAGGAGGLQSVGNQAQNYGDTQSQQAASLLSSQMGGAQNNLFAQQQAASEYDAGFNALMGLFLGPWLDQALKAPTKPKKTVA